MAKLKGKVAVVTGASKGIGAAIALKLAGEGAKIVVNYSSDKAGAEKVAAAVKNAGGEAIIVQGDVSREPDVKRIFAETKKAFGKVDILVNNAGVYEFQSLEDFEERLYHKLFGVNVLGLLLVTKEAVAMMNGDGGSIINVSSIVSKTPPADASVYAGTKGAVDVITRGLAVELGPRKIRVNTLAPGGTDTEGLRTILSNGTVAPEFEQYTVSRTPLGRIGNVDDIAKAALFLASDDSGWITGEQLLVGGGIRL